MSKEINYPEFIGGQITLDQAEKVKKSGLSNSEFIRKAIDFYDEVRLNSNLEYKIRIIDECIDILKIYQDNLKNQYYQTFKFNDENLKLKDKKGVNLKGQNMGLYKENDPIFKDIDENLKDEKYLKGQSFKDIDENLKDEKNENQFNEFQPIIDTIIRLIANKGHLSREDYGFQASRIGKTSNDLKKFIYENQDYLQKEANKYR